MDLSDRQKLERNFDSHNYGFIVKCLVQLQREWKILYQDIQQVILVYKLVVQCKLSIGIVGNATDVVQEKKKSNENEEAKVQMKTAIETLDHYMTKQLELKGV